MQNQLLVHQAGRGSRSKLACQLRKAQPLRAGRSLGALKMPRSHLVQPFLTHSVGWGNQGGLPKEVGMEEHTYMSSFLGSPNSH